MARPQRKGFDYFNIDTDILQDPRVKRLRRKYKCDGFSVYITILADIFHYEGYYVEYSEDYVLDITEYWYFDDGEREEGSYVKEIVDYCVAIGLFDIRFFVEQSILTSKAIQDRYVAMCKGAKRTKCEISLTTNVNKCNNKLGNNSVNSEETIVSSEETPFITEETPVSSEKSTQSKVKYSIYKENTTVVVSKKKQQPPQLEEVLEYFKAEQLQGSAQSFYNYNQRDGWRKVVDWKAAAQCWSEHEPQHAARKAFEQPHVANVDFTEALRVKPTPSQEEQFKKKMQEHIAAYKKGNRSSGVVNTLRTQKRNGNLEKMGLEWEEN